jgi:hypothetical protein
MKNQLNWLKSSILGSLLVVFAIGSATAHEEELDRSKWIEKQKKVTYSYSLRPSDKININNQFGDVKMKLWQENSIKVDIIITANAPTESRAVEFLRMVEIANRYAGGEVSFKTILNTQNSTYKNNLNWTAKQEDKNQLRVDYLVYLPKNHALTIDNSFGDIYLPSMESSVRLKQNHGTLFAENITHDDSNVEINFGKAFIKSMHGGDLKAEYSVLHINEANKTRLENRSGKIQIKELIDVDGIISYSTGFLETIKEAANFKIDFSNGLRLGNIDKDVKVVEIDCNYSSFELPVNTNSEFNFDVKTVNGKVKFPENREVRFSRNSDTETKKGVYAPKSFYSGSMGDSKNKTKIIINSRYGNVKIK